MNTYIIEAVVLAVLAVGASFESAHITSLRYEARISQMKQAQAQAVADAQAHVAKVVQEQAAISARTSHDYEERLAALRHRYSNSAIGLRVPTSRTGNLSAPAQGTGGIDAALPDSVPAEQCAETTLMLDQLQGWVRAQGEAP